MTTSKLHNRSVAPVDADDDSIERWVVRHYAYDPERRERRHQVVAAFDNEVEFLALIGELSLALRDRQGMGLADEKEHYTGAWLEPGYRDRQQAHRLEWKRAVSRRGPYRTKPDG